MSVDTDKPIPGRAHQVSIAIPSYNQGAYIEKMIRSVLNQDYPYIEHLFTGHTLSILKRYNAHLSW